MNKNLMSLAIASVFGLSAFAVSAEEAYQGSWYVIPSVSAVHPDGVLGADGVGPGLSLRIGKELDEHWDIQVGGGYAYADPKSGAGKYEQSLLGIDALYFFSRNAFRPYVLAGIGGAYNNIDYSTQKGNNTSWAANVGVGAQYLFTEALGVQAELRHVWSEAKATDLAGFTDRKTAGNTYLSLGGIFKFGTPKAVAAAPVVTSTPEPVAASQVAPVAAAVAPTPEACKPRVETITIASETLFGFDKATLKTEGKPALDEVAAKIKAHTDVQLVLVTGYTDSIGREAYNQKLSEHRANTVKDYLVSQGIDAARLQAVGKGESDPVVDGKGVKGRKNLVSALAPNRRVVIDTTHEQPVGCNK
ncbi:MAG: OmpA family protein [Methylophilaceae bacterium]|nr:OmpA family protein [Methylophilaceae bacterium]